MKASHSKTTKHKPITVKLEKTEGKKVQKACQPDYDLTHHVKDRVELMKQIFSILKDRELLAMAPDCLRSLTGDELQEALLDEVLGISSKRLRSILDGFQCPSNTDSSEDSTAEALETISLDSISSDDEILSHQDQKSKKKHAKKKSKIIKTKKKNKSNENTTHKNSNVKGKKTKKENSINESQTLEDGSGNGMTVLELLELQARARAIRAQLAAVEVKDNNTQEVDDKDDTSESSESDEDEVVIKEEPPDIVEIQSSSDEHDNENDSNKDVITRKTSESVQNLQKQNQTQSRNSPEKISIEASSSNSSNIQQIQPPRKIKLNRTNLLVSVSNNSKNVTTASSNLSKSVPENSNKITQLKENLTSHTDKSKDNMEFTKNSQAINLKKDTKQTAIYSKKSNSGNEKIDQSDLDLLEKIKTNNSSVRAQKKSIVRERHESEGDEITLELSDSEKMLLEGFQSPKSCSENIEINDNDLTSNQDSKNKSLKSTAILNENFDNYSKKRLNKHDNLVNKKRKINNKNVRKRAKFKECEVSEADNSKTVNFSDSCSQNIANPDINTDDGIVLDENIELSFEISLSDKSNENANKSDGECSHSSNDAKLPKENPDVLFISDDEISETVKSASEKVLLEEKNSNECKLNENLLNDDKNENLLNDDENENLPNDEKNENIESTFKDTIELVDKKNDEEIQNMEIDTSLSINVNNDKKEDHENILNQTSFDCVLEISDNSEDDACNVFSKEPTIEEIEELSRKVDYEIERENLDISEDSSINLKIDNNEKSTENVEQNDTSVEGMSWKSRWLKSNKVQRVLATSNLCNALRKKNIELKKKLEKKSITADTETTVVTGTVESPIEEPVIIAEINENQEIEGSVSQYEKLTGSTKYVDPVQEPKVDDKAMAIDAKQLMKMYKQLLKIHSLDDNEESLKKKSKKNKKDKKREKKEKKKNKTKDATQSDTVLVDTTPTDENKELSENSENISTVDGLE